MKSELNALCSYAKEKIAVSELTKRNYISTENMAPNRGGVAEAATLPTTEFTQRYRRGDVLVSNIRPYFKKIWLAREEGGCSNDVLVFRAADVCEPTFLYYVLADDAFFDYSTSTAKGTKMPRGDKSAIMKYEVPVFERETQGKIAAILSALDDKIELNRRVNANLEQQAAAIFKSKFCDFDDNAGQMPSNWNVATFGEIAEVTSGKRPSMKRTEFSEDVNVPLVGASTIMGYTNNVLYNEPILVIGRVGTHGVVQRFQTPCWPSDNTLAIKSEYYEYAFHFLKNVDYVNMNRGSTQPLITQTDLKNLAIVLPEKRVLKEFEKLTGTLMARWETNRAENEKLAAVRDALLPRLMSGEIDVSDVSL